MIDAIVVAVPVNNEAQALPSCIAGMREALRRAREVHPEVAVAVAFSLDRCTDDSAAIIESARFGVVESRRPGVGAARAEGVAAGLSALGGFADHRILVACTDADSVVPPNWLVHQIDLANDGADLIVGTVRPDRDELDEARRRAWDATHLDGQARGHVHGANLALRANVYRAIGGFAPLVEHEDVDLVARAVSTGAQVRPTAANCVVTSARLDGRTAGGYAGYLRNDLLRLAGPGATEQSVA